MPDLYNNVSGSGGNIINQSEYNAIVEEFSNTQQAGAMPAGGCVPNGYNMINNPMQPMQRPTVPQQAAMVQSPVQPMRSRLPQMNSNGYYFNFGNTPMQTQAQPVQNLPAMQNTAVQSAGVQAPTANKAAAKKRSKIGLAGDCIVIMVMILVFSFCSVLLLNAGGKMNTTQTEQKSFFSDLTVELRAFKSDSVSAIFEIPKVYILPWGEDPAPKPNENGYSTETDENGNEIQIYKDETIEVRYWTERLYKSDCHFAEIKVEHPTQLRTAYAGGIFGTATKYTPQTIAQQVNAVIAINADFCSYRDGGILVRQNTLYRNAARGWDILLIDSDGNFHLMQDSQVKSSGVMEEYEIVNTLVFGPTLIIDGEVNLLNLNSGCGPYWNEEHPSPRTGIGQIGELHYLFCVVEGRSDTSKGVFTSQLANIMLDKGCVQAYNLDGGKSTTMVFGGEAMNKPLWGGQRVVSDIVYCATAIPDNE